MATFVNPVSTYFGMTNKVVKLWEMALSEETRECMGVLWKETWKLKGDEPPSDQDTSFIIELGKGETETHMHLSNRQLQGLF